MKETYGVSTEIHRDVYAYGGQDHYKEMLSYQLDGMQRELGLALANKLYASSTPLLVWVHPMESYNGDGSKRLSIRTEVTQTRLDHMPEEYLIPTYAPIARRVPHFEYFPKDWICNKCGCINDGLAQPRMCAYCNAPRKLK